MERAALSRRPPGFSGAGALTMEQAKISSARGTPAAQPTRAPAPVVADADDGTPATGFAAWLAGGDGRAPERGAGAGGSPSGLAASDAADGGGHALTLAARHGGAAGAADMPDGSDGPPGADDGLTAWAALTALAALTAVTALTQGGRPQGLVAETA